MVEGDSNFGCGESPLDVVAPVLLVDDGLSAGELALDLLRGTGGDVWVHAGPDGGEYPVEF